MTLKRASEETLQTVKKVGLRFKICSYGAPSLQKVILASQTNSAGRNRVLPEARTKSAYLTGLQVSTEGRHADKTAKKLTENMVFRQGCRLYRQPKEPPKRLLIFGIIP